MTKSSLKPFSLPRIALTGFALAFSFAANPVFAQAQLSGTQDELRDILFPRPNEVSIEGNAEISAFMDSAHVDLIVTTEDRSLEEAMRSNQALRVSLSNNFIDAGIDAEAINNAKFSSSPQQGLFTRRTNGFEVSARLQVTIESEAQLQLLAAAADSHDEVELGKMVFEHSDAVAFEQRARELAMQDALAKAETYGKTLGLELTPINFFSHSFARQARYESALMRSAVAMDAANLPPSANNFDEVNYESSVTVTFEITRD